MARGRPGPAPQTAKRAQFARVIAQGVSNSAACRIVGITGETGKRWQHGPNNHQQQQQEAALILP